MALHQEFTLPLNELIERFNKDMEKVIERLYVMSVEMNKAAKDLERCGRMFPKVPSHLN